MATPWYRGARARTTHQPAVQPGLVTQTTAPPAEQAAIETARRPAQRRHSAGPGRGPSHRHRCRRTGLLERGANDSEDPGHGPGGSPSSAARKSNGHGRKPARGPWLSLEGGGAGGAWREAIGSHIRARSGVVPATRIAAVTGGVPWRGRRASAHTAMARMPAARAKAGQDGPVAGRARKGRCTAKVRLGSL